MNAEAQSVLVADDNAETRETIAMCLERLGYAVVCACDGREAIDVCEEHRFDVIVTDMLMPRADGLEVVMAVRRSQPDARIIAMSGGGDFFGPADLLKTVRLLGADVQLAKPFSREQLLGALGRFAATAVGAT